MFEKEITEKEHLNMSGKEEFDKGQLWRGKPEKGQIWKGRK